MIFLQIFEFQLINCAFMHTNYLCKMAAVFQCRSCTACMTLQTNRK